MPRIQFQQSAAGTLEFYAPEGIPDGAASLTIYTGGDSTLSGETWPLSVSLTSASTTVNGAASQYAQSLTLDDASAFVARTQRYLIDDGGALQEITVSRKSGDTIYLDHELREGVADGATVASHRYSYTLSSAQTTTKRRRLRAVWSYDVDSVTYTHTQYFSIVGEPFSIDVTEEDIARHDLDFEQYADGDGAWRKLVGGAHDDVERCLRAKSLAPDLLRDRDALRDAVIFGVLSKIYQRQPDRSELWRGRMERALTDAVEARAWYDEDDDHQGGDEDSSIIYDTDGNILGTLNGDTLETATELGVPANYMRVG